MALAVAKEYYAFDDHMKRFFAVLLLVSYTAFLVVCGLFFFADPPWAEHGASGDWQGMLGFLASMAAGFPLSMLCFLFTNLIGDTEFQLIAWGLALMQWIIALVFTLRVLSPSKPEKFQNIGGR